MVDFAKSHNLITMIDNTWGTALHHNALDLGVDVVIEAGTKYITGHSDVNLGIACARGQFAKKLRFSTTALGICAGPEDLYLGIRGLRTMNIRLKQSEKTWPQLSTICRRATRDTSNTSPCITVFTRP